MGLLLLGILCFCLLPDTPLRAQTGGWPFAGAAIWPAGNATPGTVALFRKRFTLRDSAEGVSLAIFADTRYEAYLDGVWLGRGPARFSTVRQEYDVLPVSNLAAGEHVLAILVQFAPNVRRSETIRAGLLARLSGRVAGADVSLVASDATWRASVSPAWNPNARQVSDLGLIGPQELLDLRQLPADWMLPAFDDRSWSPARTLFPAPFTALSPRSIPLLANTPRTPTAVLDAGLLSPGLQLVDLEPPTGSQPHAISLRANADATLRIEALEQATLLLDGQPLEGWKLLNDPRRPDVRFIEHSLAAGQHTLLAAVPAGGRALLIGGEGILVEAAPPQTQGRDAGRRTLLLHPQTNSVLGPSVQLRTTGADILVPDAPYPRYVALSFARTLHGRISVTVDGPPGTLVDIGLDERLRDGRVLPAPGSLHDNLWQQVDSWVLDGTTRTLTTIDARAGQYLLLQVIGPGPVRIRQLQVIEEHYPRTWVGNFASSDAQLNRIWIVGAETTALNMLDAYADPWRERGQWWGDVMASYWVNEAVFGDQALLRRGLRQMADEIGPDGRPPAFAPRGADITLLLDYGMLWIEGLHHYWQRTGDLDLVRELYPAALRLDGFLQSYEGPNGLLRFPAAARWYESALIDWAAGPARRGESSAVNAQYAASLGLLAELATALQRPEAATFRERQRQVADAINQQLFDPAMGGYVTSRLDGTTLAERPQAQAWPLVYGVVPPERRRQVAQTLSRQLTPFVQPTGPVVEIYGMHWVLRALGATGQTDQALTIVRAQYGSLLDRGATTWWEGFTSDRSFAGSLSHGWGGAPTWFLSQHVLGAQATAPKQWQVAPHPGDLRWAAGTIPTSAGPLSVEWNRPACGQLELKFEAPAGSEGRLLLPITRSRSRAFLDGTLVWDNGPVARTPATLTAAGLLIDGLGGGSHSASYSTTCSEGYLPVIRR